MTSYALKPLRCWNCQYEIDRATGAGHQFAPSPGDFTICMRCGEFAVFTEDLRQRKPTDEEFAALAESKDARKARDLWALIQQKRSAEKPRH